MYTTLSKNLLFSNNPRWGHFILRAKQQNLLTLMLGLPISFHECVAYFSLWTFSQFVHLHSGSRSARSAAFFIHIFLLKTVYMAMMRLFAQKRSPVLRLSNCSFNLMFWLLQHFTRRRSYVSSNDVSTTFKDKSLSHMKETKRSAKISFPSGNYVWCMAYGPSGEIKIYFSYLSLTFASTT